MKLKELLIKTAEKSAKSSANQASDWFFYQEKLPKVIRSNQEKQQSER